MVSALCLVLIQIDSYRLCHVLFLSKRTISRHIRISRPQLGPVQLSVHKSLKTIFEDMDEDDARSFKKIAENYLTSKYNNLDKSIDLEVRTGEGNMIEQAQEEF